MTYTSRKHASPVVHVPKVGVAFKGDDESVSHDATAQEVAEEQPEVTDTNDAERGDADDTELGDERQSVSPRSGQFPDPPDEYKIARAPALMVKKIPVMRRLPEVETRPSASRDHPAVKESNVGVIHDERLVCLHCEALLYSQEAFEEHKRDHKRQTRRFIARQKREFDHTIPSQVPNTTKLRGRWKGPVFSHEAQSTFRANTERAQQAAAEEYYHQAYYHRHHDDDSMLFTTTDGDQYETVALEALPPDHSARTGSPASPHRTPSPRATLPAHAETGQGNDTAGNVDTSKDRGVIAQRAQVNLSRPMQDNLQRYRNEFMADHYERESHIKAKPPPAWFRNQQDEIELERPDSRYLYTVDTFLHLDDDERGTDPVMMSHFCVLPEPDTLPELEPEPSEAGLDVYDDIPPTPSSEGSLKQDELQDDASDSSGTVAARGLVPVVVFPSTTWEEDKDKALQVSEFAAPALEDYLPTRRHGMTSLTIQEQDDRRVVVENYESEDVKFMRELRSFRRDPAGVNNSRLFYNNRRRRLYSDNAANPERVEAHEEVNIHYKSLKRRSGLVVHGSAGSENALPFVRYERDVENVDDMLDMKAATLGGHTFTKYKVSQRSNDASSGHGDTVAANKNTLYRRTQEDRIVTESTGVAAPVPTVPRVATFADKNTQRALAGQHQVIAVRAEALHKTGAGGAMIQGNLRVSRQPNPGHVFFFAYGRLMSQKLLEQQLGHKVEPASWGVLFEYSFKWNKRGLHADAGSLENIQRVSGKSAEGCVYELSNNDLATLDAYNACPEHYTRGHAVAWITRKPGDPFCTDTVPVVFYTAAPDWLITLNPPKPTPASIKEVLNAATMLSPAARQHIENVNDKSLRFMGKSPRIRRLQRSGTLLSNASSKTVKVVELSMKKDDKG